MHINKLKSRIQIDFEEWARLAKVDPDRFEVQRDRTIAEAISRAPVNRQHHLRCLQWRVDRVRERTSNPLAACIAISDMMWNTFHNLNDSYKELQNPGLQRPEAKILAFQPKAR